MEKQALVDRQN
jgi:hypothetical protein